MTEKQRGRSVTLGKTYTGEQDTMNAGHLATSLTFPKMVGLNIIKREELN